MSETEKAKEPEKATAKAPETKESAKKGLLAAVLVRGLVGIHHEIKEALFTLNIRDKHVCVVLPDTPLVRGQLRKCKDYITFGTVSAAMKEKLEKERGQKAKDGKLKKYFRLPPPRGGWGRKGIKKSFAEGGALGWRAEKMEQLLDRML